ncbi:cAMP-binding protein [Schinkia azotoformans MEV2011]|uniref:cAMP-binding protein n=2 Tax=Schinkia azotoformans TaxID=1454 RepID=A0A072NP35_SCHAZ|nr:cAMP-binding protein [Schinkia azotoformans MEV2011]
MSMYVTDNQNNRLIEPYLKFATRKFIKKNTILYTQGEVGQGFYYILDGMVKISTLDFKKNCRILDISASGKLIGEQSLTGHPYFTTATVIKDSVLYYFTIQTYNQFLQVNPDIRNFITKSILGKVKLHVSDLNVKSFPTENQVAFYLLRLLDIFSQDKINLTQQELAKYTGLTRITIYRILKKWEEEGILSISNRKIYILKPDILKHYVDSQYASN